MGYEGEKPLGMSEAEEEEFIPENEPLYYFRDPVNPCDHQLRESSGKCPFCAVPEGHPRYCPDCEALGRQTLTVQKRNRQNGNLFTGCSGYPECRWTYGRKFLKRAPAVVTMWKKGDAIPERFFRKDPPVEFSFGEPTKTSPPMPKKKPTPPAKPKPKTQTQKRFANLDFDTDEEDE